MEQENKNIKTYAEDMAQTISGGGGGMIKNIIHQEEAYEQEKKNSSPLSKKNRFFLLASLALLILAFGTLAFLVTFKEDIQTIDVKQEFSPIIFADKTAYLEVSGLDKEEIVQSFLNEIAAAELKANGVATVYLTENKSIIGLSRFLALISGNLVNSNVFSENFLLGASSDAKDPFVVLQTRSFTDAFASMRAWEKQMFTDLHRFFGMQINADTNYLLTRDFKDVIIGNKNARALYDESGNTVLAYVFASDNSVVIIGNDVTAMEVILRLSSNKVGK